MSDSGPGMSASDGPERRAEAAFHGYLERRAAGTAPTVAEFVAEHDRSIREHLRALLDDYHALLEGMGGAESGHRLGPYRLGRKLGEGAVGVVWEAVETSSGQRCALKVLRPHLGLSGRARERFLREARIGAKLEHEGIVSVLGAGSEGDTHYLVQELVGDGRSLAEVLDRTDWRRLDGERVRKVARWFRDVAQAVHHAHEQGVVHRDLKPGNLLLQGGRLRVADFGFAFLEEEASRSLSGTVGTVAYMSPEQLAGRRRLDGRSDQFSLGAAFYEALCGQRPFAGDSREEVADQIAFREPVALHVRAPVVPADLSAVVHKCLEKDRVDRYRDLASVAADLDRFLRGASVEARPPGPLLRVWRRCRRRPRTCAAVAILLIAASLLGVLWRADLLRARTEQERASYFRALDRAAVEMANGRALSAFDYLGSAPSAQRGLEWHLLQAHLDGGRVHWVRALESAHKSLSTAAGWVALHEGADLHFFRDGINERTLSFPEPVRRAVLGLDGRFAAAAGVSGVTWLLDTSSGESREIAVALDPTVPVLLALRDGGFAGVTTSGEVVWWRDVVEVAPWAADRGAPTALAERRDSDLIVGTEAGEVFRLDHEGATRWRVELGGGAVRALGCVRDFVLVGCEDGSVRRLEADDGEEDFRWGDHRGGVVALAHRDDGLFVSLSGVGRMRVYGLGAELPFAETLLGDDGASQVALLEHGDPVTLSSHGSLDCWPLDPVEQRGFPASGGSASFLLCDGTQWGHAEGAALVRRDLATGAVLGCSWAGARLRQLWNDPRGSRVVGWDEEGTLSAWSDVDGSLEWTHSLGDGPVVTVAFPDRAIAVVGETTATFFDRATGEELAHCAFGEFGRARAAAGDAQDVLLATESGVVRLRIGADAELWIPQPRPVEALSASSGLCAFADASGVVFVRERHGEIRQLVVSRDGVSAVVLSVEQGRVFTLDPDRRLLRAFTLDEGAEVLQWTVDPGLDRFQLSADRSAILLSSTESDAVLRLSVPSGPRDPFDWTQRGRIGQEATTSLRESGTVEEALAHWRDRRGRVAARVAKGVEAEIEARGDDPHALLNEVSKLADLVAFDRRQALEWARRAYRLLPKSSRARLILAFAESAEGDWGRAEELLAECPPDPVVELGRLLAAWHGGRRQDARAAWESLRGEQLRESPAFWRNELSRIGSGWEGGE